MYILFTKTEENIHLENTKETVLTGPVGPDCRHCVLTRHYKNEKEKKEETLYLQHLADAFIQRYLRKYFEAVKPSS